MDSWPQVERCLLQQWRGYTPGMREAIEAQWQIHGAPGLVGAAGNAQYNLWWVEHHRDNIIRTTCGDLLMSIKVDREPFDERTLKS